MKYHLILVLFMVFVSCSQREFVTTHEMRCNNEQIRKITKNTASFYPVWDTSHFISVPHGIVEAIQDANNITNQHKVEVTTVIPTIGYIRVDGEEYRWLITDEVLSEELFKKGKIIRLPDSYSLYKNMTLSDFHKLWRHAEKIQSKDKKNNKKMSVLLQCIFDKMH
ncbi:MAG: hypothetical protein MJ058_08940 [Akkermansia sp.]|nr:hypothetical protein [Akkermansia sp.]